MHALVVVDAQNEFSANGLRPVPNHDEALGQIRARVAESRAQGWPIAWVRHHNKPTESRAFVPGSWGAEFSDTLGPQSDYGPEKLFEKDVFGAFTGTELESWLRANAVTELMIVGFYTHMCVSTSAREALVRGFDVSVDAAATGATGIHDELLGRQSADDVRRSALLHLAHMGATILSKDYTSTHEAPYEAPHKAPHKALHEALHDAHATADRIA
jgi:nicotinamidase-related amidase